MLFPIRWNCILVTTLFSTAAERVMPLALYSFCPSRIGTWLSAHRGLSVRIPINTPAEEGAPAYAVLDAATRLFISPGRMNPATSDPKGARRDSRTSVISRTSDNWCLLISARAAHLNA